ncbi:hypothetical protein [Streptomyces acidicola]|uniref:hypothetical protein n=1 Tax=Streptomyces acidicola TaxID=2596892 RepID=UPI00188476FE|nr:hypothetical protein [Streptomyces acidicola]
MLRAQALLDTPGMLPRGGLVLDDLGTHSAIPAGRPQNTGLAVVEAAAPARYRHTPQPPARIADLRDHHLGEPGGEPVVKAFGVGALAQLAAHLTGDLPDDEVVGTTPAGAGIVRCP